FCIRLSSDSASRQTPLPSLTVPLTRARRGLSPPSLTTYRSHLGKGFTLAIGNSVVSVALKLLLSEV
ncbi:MAG: hypothetical protein WAM28_07680, partial [Chlamydiales bacterium]